MDDAPVVSVVIPVFNSAPTLQAAIDSARAQSLQEIEILIVDDGSADASLVIAEAAAARDPRVHVIAMGRNGGKPRALNHAVDRVRGRWMAVLDADDTFLSQRLEHLVAIGEQNAVDMVSDDQNHIDHVTGMAVGNAFLGYRFDNPVDRQGFLRLATHPHREFDFGILKTVIRTLFVRTHRLRYNEHAGLGEDFYYLMEFFMCGGTLWVSDAALYNWTLPFSPTARRWTRTGMGEWRYDYRRTFPAHDDYLRRLDQTTDADMLHMLRRRGRRMRRMMHYTDAQKAAADGFPMRAAATLMLHPSTLPVMWRRVIRRFRRDRGLSRRRQLLSAAPD